MQLTDEQRDALLADAEAMVARLAVMFAAHRDLLHDLRQLPLSVSGISPKSAAVSVCIEEVVSGTSCVLGLVIVRLRVGGVPCRDPVCSRLVPQCAVCSSLRADWDYPSGQPWQVNSMHWPMIASGTDHSVRAN